MEISEHGLEFIAGFEGYRYNAYWDPYGHCWTVGIGETQNVGPNSTMTYAQALADLKGRLAREYEPALTALGVPLNQNQWDALCSFIWNLGPGSMSWDVGRDLRARNYDAAANALLEYDRAGGVVLSGLARRRQAERTLFLTPVPAPKPPPLSYHYNWYPVSWQTAVRRYDALRRLQARSRMSRIEGLWLLARKKQCGSYAKSIARNAIKRHPLQDGKPSWDVDHRGWLYQELLRRSRGELVKPS